MRKTLFFIVVNYLLLPTVVAHSTLSLTRWGTIPWDPREVLILIPLGRKASTSVSSAGEVSIFITPIAILLLLIPVVQPFRRFGVWANPSLVTLTAIIALSCVTAKFYYPYSWNHFETPAMFSNRQWYRHPVYGPMYVQRDVLQMYQPMCDEIRRSGPDQNLLSIPYSNPNYFCDIAPWHGYVQTFFDTSTAETIHHLMDELNTAPPQWIIYQRQMIILEGAERNYNGGRPLAHHELDTLIQQKILSGQWRVVIRADGPPLALEILDPRDGWFLIQTSAPATPR